METLKKILKTIGSFLLTVVLTVIAVFIIIAKMNNTTDEKDKAEKNKEDKKNELEEKSADDIAADSPNADTISSNIRREQEELRQRIRDRFNKNIHRNGSSGDAEHSS